MIVTSSVKFHGERRQRAKGYLQKGIKMLIPGNMKQQDKTADKA